MYVYVRNTTIYKCVCICIYICVYKDVNIYIYNSDT